MKLRTKNKVTINDGVKGSRDEHVEGHIETAAWMDGFEAVGVNYVYADSNGVPFHQSSFVVSGDQIDALYNAVKEGLPAEGTHREIERTKFYLAFAYEMAKTLEIETSEIELVS